MAEIARRTTVKHNRLLFLVHRTELVDQAKETFIQNDVNMNLCQINTIQTFRRHLDKIHEPQVILVDEAHHALAKTYQDILNQYPKAIKLYFTATPIRGNGRGLKDIATDLIPGKQIKWLIKQGYMAPIKYYAPPSAVDNRKLKKSSTGDYTKKSIDAATDSVIYGNAVEFYQKVAEDKQAIIYTYSVASAYQAAQKFRDAGYTCEALDGSVKKQKRQEIIHKFKNKQIQMLVNVDLFTEGLDLPNVDCVIMLRPTASLPLYLQFAMRCMNPRKGKTAIIIDHVDNISKFGLPTRNRKWDLEGRKLKKKKQNGISLKHCQYCFGTFDASEVVNNQCPLCGADLPVINRKRKVGHVKGTLVEIKEDEIEEAEQKIWNEIKFKDWHELKNYRQLYVYGKYHGYKKGWTYYKAQELGMIRR